MPDRHTLSRARSNPLLVGISPDLVPTIGPTIASPLQYGYRTKLTPHFQGPPHSVQKAWKRGEAPVVEDKPDWLKIGFHAVGTRNVMDIEVSRAFIPSRLSLTYACRSAR